MSPFSKFARHAVIVLATVGITATAARAEDKSMDRLITISASAHVSAEPDMARISTGVTTEADTAREALTRNTDAMKKIIAGLKANGVEPKDIQTSNFNISPRYTQPKDGRPPVINGYTVNNQVDVRARDLAKLGDVMDQLVTLGANQVHGLSFEVSKAETLKDEARKLAVANARRRAELLVAAAGSELGEVVQISEDVQGFHPQPVFAGRAKMAAAEAVPIEAGSQDLEARVTITWRLK